MLFLILAKLVVRGYMVKSNENFGVSLDSPFYLGCSNNLEFIAFFLVLIS